jgi:hypothetical protein
MYFFIIVVSTICKKSSIIIRMGNGYKSLGMSKKNDLLFEEI